ncbi:hypothetical protein [Lelliottia sp. WAP21]|uniref:hypothetical protein n=1 Tax=Lelliottia sp. WAP21 TaxID=2877426 RepID=UPI001E34D5B3|nr:hypothetical protein [Lelliottia sp. WAP21]
MRYYAALIDILYNPVRYCDNSWLALPYVSSANYFKNHFILDQCERISFSNEDIFESLPVSLFIINWNKIKQAAFMIGLKLLSAHLIRTPLRMKKLSAKEREFLCLPIPLQASATVPDQAMLSDEIITHAGADFIYFLAIQILPPVLRDRLKLVFPSSFEYSKTSYGNLDKSLSVLKWAFDYA